MILEQYKQLIADEKKVISILANTSAFIFQNFENLNWAGFYEVENETLYLSAFQGKVACYTIPFSRGVCGKAARNKEVVVVDDVHKFEDHIACDSASLSEIVIPIIIKEKLFAVLDIDAPILARFDNKTKEKLVEIAKILEEKLSKLI